MNRVFLSFLLLAVACMVARAQNVIVEENAITVECEDIKHSTTHYKTVTTILNERGADHAVFICPCSKYDKLKSFRGQVTDPNGRLLRKLKESELQRTEYSEYLAVDDYRMYLDYTPPSYPVTITYEWTVESRNNLIEFPWFCPQDDYDVSVRKATYQLTAPQTMAIRHTLSNISKDVTVSSDNGLQTLSIELTDLPVLRKEPYSRPLNERLPMGYFAPEQFVYYGVEGSFTDWNGLGKWEYSLQQGRDVLPESLKEKLHQLADGLPSDVEKVKRVYQFLGENTRYVAILLGIGGQQPAPAAEVCKSGFGDCKGLTNYMRAMLQELGISSYYTVVSTTRRRLLPHYASVGQLNHVILQVPLRGDTIWMECTNPQLPFGYVHEDIAGHDAVVVTADGGRMVRLPVYADSTNMMCSEVQIALSTDGSADVSLRQTSENWQHEQLLPLLKMDENERFRALHHIVNVPQMAIQQMETAQQSATISLTASIKSGKYAKVTGRRLFVPLCPIHQGYQAPKSEAERSEDICISHGYLDTDEIVLTIPEGYAIEARPRDVTLTEAFGSFSFRMVEEGRQIRISNRLLMHAGVFPSRLYPQLVAFRKTLADTYAQKLVLKRI